MSAQWWRGHDRLARRICAGVGLVVAARLAFDGAESERVERIIQLERAAKIRRENHWDAVRVCRVDRRDQRDGLRNEPEPDFRSLSSRTRRGDFQSEAAIGHADNVTVLGCGNAAG